MAFGQEVWSDTAKKRFGRLRKSLVEHELEMTDVVRRGHSALSEDGRSQLVDAVEAGYFSGQDDLEEKIEAEVVNEHDRSPAPVPALAHVHAAVQPSVRAELDAKKARSRQTMQEITGQLLERAIAAGWLADLP